MENDLLALNSHLPDPRLYTYHSWLSRHYGISDYCSNARIVLSSKEEVRDTRRRTQEETISYIQEMTEEGRMLSKYTLFNEEEHSVSGHPLTTIDLFLHVSHPISSQIMTAMQSDLSLVQRLESIREEAKHNAVVLCLEKNDGKVIREGLANAQISYVDGPLTGNGRAFTFVPIRLRKVSSVCWSTLSFIQEKNCFRKKRSLSVTMRSLKKQMF